MDYTRDEAAVRAGVEPAYLDRLAALEIVVPVGGRYTGGGVRRVMLVRSIENAGVSTDAMAGAVRAGTLNLDFLDSTAYERFTAFAAETYGEASERTGIPMSLLAVIRESMGLAEPAVDDRLRADELPVVAFIEAQLAVGFRPGAIERLLRVQGDATRRITESEGAWWISEVIEPALTSGRGIDGLADAVLADRLSPLSEQAILAMYHAQQTRAWTANIIEAFEQLLASAGLHSRLERPPAVCFLDISGYTRLTQEHGDGAAADLAASVAALVQRSSVQHGGKPIKWLGDGVMFYFRDPGGSVTAALEMLDGLASAGLPPAHVGLHAGPVLFQQGDYFGQTVNLSARIADYAPPGQVLVSREMAALSRDEGISFHEVGPVELKNVAGPVDLLRAQWATT